MFRRKSYLRWLTAPSVLSVALSSSIATAAEDPTQAASPAQVAPSCGN